MKRNSKFDELSESEQEYYKFFEDGVKQPTDSSIEPIYRVHFYCMECRMVWNYETEQISQAVVMACKDGCPLCNEKSRVALTHHELLKEEDDIDIRDFMVVGVFSDSTNKY